MGSHQLALKILANATSYGIFDELIVDELDLNREPQCFGSGNDGFPVRVDKVETPCRYFHPLLATLITGLAARLVIDTGLDWAFGDTDFMAIAKPEGTSTDTFFATAHSVCDWFTPLQRMSLEQYRVRHDLQAGRGRREKLALPRWPQPLPKRCKVHRRN